MLSLPSVTSVGSAGILQCRETPTGNNCMSVPVVNSISSKNGSLRLDFWLESARNVRRNVMAVAVNANYKAPPMILLTSLQQLHRQSLPQTVIFFYLQILRYRNRLLNSQKPQFKLVLSRPVRLLLVPKMWQRNRKLSYSLTQKPQASLRMVHPGSWSILPLSS